MIKVVESATFGLPTQTAQWFFVPNVGSCVNLWHKFTFKWPHKSIDSSGYKISVNGVSRHYVVLGLTMNECVYITLQKCFIL